MPGDPARTALRTYVRVNWHLVMRFSSTVCVCIRDANKENHWFLSILDRATSYHMLELMRDHSPVELHLSREVGRSGQGVP